MVTSEVCNQPPPPPESSIIFIERCSCVDASVVGILCPNTPAFLEAIYGIAAGGAVQVGVNYRLKPLDIHYIFEHSEVDLIIVDREYLHLLDGFNPAVKRVIDDDTDATEGELSGEYDAVIREGLEYDRKNGAGWEGLQLEAQDEDDIIALAYTSGTTARPKVRQLGGLRRELHVLTTMHCSRAWSSLIEECTWARSRT